MDWEEKGPIFVFGFLIFLLAFFFIGIGIDITIGTLHQKYLEREAIRQGLVYRETRGWVKAQ